MTRILRGLLAVALLATSFAGCGYHLAGRGSFLPERIRSIGIPPFQSSIARRDVVEKLTAAVTREFVSRGGYRIRPTAQDADAVLEGTITALHQAPIALDADGRATRARLIITAGVVLREQKDGRALYESPAFQFSTEIELSSSDTGFFEPESEGIEDISREFARSLVATIVEGF